MATTDFIAAIELSTSKIVGIAGKKNSDGSIQVLAYAQEHGTPCIRKGGIYNIDKTVQALRSIIHKLESQLDSSIAKVYTSINGQSLRTIENSVNRTLNEEQIISQELVDEMCDDNLNMPLSDQTILDVVPQEYRMDNNTLQTDPVGVKTARVVGQYLNIVARATLKKNLEYSFEQAQIKIADLFTAPSVMAEHVLQENEMRAGCALVDFGADTTTVVIYKNNILRHLSVLPLGGNTITHDITSLQMEEEDAELLKLRFGDALYDENEGKDMANCSLPDGRSIDIILLNNIIGARTEEILANVWNLIQLSGYADKLFSGIVFTGGGSNLKHLEEAFRKYSGVEKVKTVNTVQHTVHGIPEALKRDGTQCTLLAMLAAGNENCCRPVAAPVAPTPVTPTPEPQPTDAFDHEAALKKQEEENRRKQEEEEKQREEEEKKRKEEEKLRKEEEKKKKTGWWRRKIDNLTKEIFEEE